MPGSVPVVVSAVLALVGLAGGACRARPTPSVPAIELTRVPEATEGGPDRMAPIAGRARGARPGQRIVLYARSGPWWVQPLAEQPFTELRADSSFENTTHLGTEYAALLVEPGYRPPHRSDDLPALEGLSVMAVTVALLGPGAYSVDARLFGRREIVVPRASRGRLDDP